MLVGRLLPDGRFRTPPTEQYQRLEADAFNLGMLPFEFRCAATCAESTLFGGNHVSQRAPGNGDAPKKLVISSVASFRALFKSNSQIRCTTSPGTPTFRLGFGTSRSPPELRPEV